MAVRLATQDRAELANWLQKEREVAEALSEAQTLLSRFQRARRESNWSACRLLADDLEVRAQAAGRQARQLSDRIAPVRRYPTGVS